MSIRPKFKDCVFENYRIENDKQGKIVEILKDYSKNFMANQGKNKSLILIGNPGTGKSHLMYAMGRVLPSMTQEKSYTMLKRIKNTWRNNAEESEAEALKDYQRTPLLWIDDVGVGFSSDADRILFYEIIDYRYEYLRPTIVTANCSLKTLTEILGERIIDRLYDNGGQVLVFDWESFRRSA